jgi:uncharacterized protein (TIGR03435 family)
MRMGPGELASQGTTLEPLVEQLSRRLGRTVVDKTGLTGNYNFTLKWTPGSQQGTDNAYSGPSIFTAIQEQLGLKLEAQTAPLGILVIDQAERLSKD